MTAQGHPRAIFKRAIERGNLVITEATAREIGRLTLDEALLLVFLLRREGTDQVRARRAPLARSAQLALSALAELRAGEREQAAKLLTELVQR